MRLIIGSCAHVTTARRRLESVSSWSCAVTAAKFIGLQRLMGIQNHWKYKAASWRHGVPRRSALTGTSRPVPSSTAKSRWRKIRSNVSRAASSVSLSRVLRRLSLSATTPRHTANMIVSVGRSSRLHYRPSRKHTAMRWRYRT